ncbi:MAG: S9 family peptidase [Acidobacteriaceae bacterium]|nr:S9 family peptidase [Acidobacteriaceae bacterium]
MHAATHVLIVAVFAAFCRGQTPAPQQLPELQKLLNIDAKDVATRLELIQEMLLKQDVQSNLSLFRQQYGERVKLEPVAYASERVQVIPGYLFSRRTIEAGKRYPALVMVHGGFHDHFDTYFFKPIAQAVEHGYIVLFPEYRGSSGYGEVHYENSYGKTDVADVLAGAAFLSKQPNVDPDRLGIVGHSRGGMVSMLAIEQEPKRFKAAVEIAGLADFVAYMSYKPEFRRQEVAQEATFGGKLPDENLKAYVDISPINHVDAIETPLLVLANTFDQTVPFALHSGRMIDMLKARGKVFDSHVYVDAPGSHMFPFANTPEAEDCWRRTFDWVGRYLKP